MERTRWKQHRHNYSIAAESSSSQSQHQNHRPTLKFCYVNKSELISPSLNSVAVERVSPNPNDVDNDVTLQNHEIDSAFDETRDVACMSEAKEGDGGVDIMGRIDTLFSATEEPQLSQEEITINDQLQQDELLVVESIYGENVFSLERWNGLRCFQIHINIDVLGEIDVTSKLSSVNELQTASSNSDDFSYSFKVQYLPPIVLTCLLPKTYPSHTPPIFTISVKWLDSMKILSLCSKLDSIWTEQQGQEIIYHWVDWLHGSSLSHLGFDKEITLGPFGMSLVADQRVVSGIECVGVDIPFLQSYNNERHDANFLKELHECCICYDEYPGTEFVQLPCKHFFCHKCLQTFAQIHVAEGTIGNLQCLDAKCTIMIPPGLLKYMLDDKGYERWESMMLEKTLASMSDVVYCPRCETPCIEDEEQHAQCPTCFFSFCTLCKERRHVGVACRTLDMKLQILQDRQNSQLKEDQKRGELKKINEMLSMKEIHRDSKLCPRCGMAISRTKGCNRMKCSNCGQYFCYRCNKAIDPSGSYGHFGDGTCESFPQELIEGWQERINHRQVVGQIHAELFHLRGSACPSCHQFNGKIGNNNHMFCWACQSHYCYLCNKIVRRGTKHFGPEGCKHQSEG